MCEVGTMTRIIEQCHTEYTIGDVLKSGRPHAHSHDDQTKIT